MKTTILTILLLFSGILIAQNDTLITNNNYKFKVGIKGMGEKSGIPSLEPINKNVFNYGGSLMYKLGNSKSLIESGFYSFIRKFNNQNEITQHNIQIPLKYRIETKIIYFSVGFYGSYLIAKDVYNKSIYSETSSDRKFNIGYTGSLGIEKNISNQFSIFMEAEFSNDLTSVKKGGSLFQLNNSYSVGGFAIGVNYKILIQ